VRHHKVGCGAALIHIEYSDYDLYRCSKCLKQWTKRKRKPAVKEVNMKVTIYGYNGFFDDKPAESKTFEGTREEVDAQVGDFALKFKSVSLDQA
jgi:hypothetical protein